MPKKKNFLTPPKPVAKKRGRRALLTDLERLELGT
jgi:hypothetical protein